MPKPYRLVVPVAMEAMQLTEENVQQVVSWTGGVVVEEIDPFDSNKRFIGVNILTRHGVERLQPGDHALKDPTGGFVRVTDEDFKQYFVPVGEEETDG